MDHVPPADPHGPLGPPLPESRGGDPYPDRELGLANGLAGREARYEQREAIELLQRAHATIDERLRTLRAAGIELDPLRRTVTRDGHPIGLSVKEFGVLEALLAASPAVLSAERLLAQVWDENSDPFTKTVQVTIARLRRQLGEPDVIETIPGAGYRIGTPAQS
jgi:DNA-binding response OmpR family regulator